MVEFKAHTTQLSTGQQAPYFEAKDQHGHVVKLSDFRDRTLVLYFYPKDDTPACTKTACSLRDEYALLGKKNYAVVGVSADSEKAHASFAKKYDLPFSLLADIDRKIIRDYDVWGQKMLFGRIYDGIVRTTFIIGADSILKHVIKGVDTANHSQQILLLENEK